MWTAGRRDPARPWATLDRWRTCPRGRSGASTPRSTRGRSASRRRSCCSSPTARRPGAPRTCCASCRPSSPSTPAARRTGSRSSWRRTRTRPSRAAASELRGMRAGLADTVRGARPARRGRGHAPDSSAPRRSRSRRAPATSTCTRALRELARREPTFALHVHVAVPDPELAVRAYNGMRAHIPVLLALAANSPFTRGARQRPGLRAHAGLPGLPAHRHPARVRRPTPSTSRRSTS